MNDFVTIIWISQLECFFAWWRFDEFKKFGLPTWCCNCSCYRMGCFWIWKWWWCSICVRCCIRREFGDVVIFEIDFLIFNYQTRPRKGLVQWLWTILKIWSKISWSTIGCSRPAVKDPKSRVGNCVGAIGHHIWHSRHVTCQLIIEKEQELSIGCPLIIQLETHFNFMPISSRYRT